MASKASEELTRSDRATLTALYVVVALGIGIAIAFGVIEHVELQSLLLRTRLTGLLGNLSDILKGILMLVGAFLMRSGRTSISGGFLMIISPLLFIDAVGALVQPEPSLFHFGLRLALGGIGMALFVKDQRQHQRRRAALVKPSNEVIAGMTEARDA